MHTIQTWWPTTGKLQEKVGVQVCLFYFIVLTVGKEIGNKLDRLFGEAFGIMWRTLEAMALPDFIGVALAAFSLIVAASLLMTRNTYKSFWWQIGSIYVGIFLRIVALVIIILFFQHAANYPIFLALIMTISASVMTIQRSGDQDDNLRDQLDSFVNDEDKNNFMFYVGLGVTLTAMLLINALI